MDDTAAAKGAAHHWASEKEAMIGAGIGIWWTDRSQSDNGLVGTAAVCTPANDWSSCRSVPGSRPMGVFDGLLWVIEFALDVSIEER